MRIAVICASVLTLSPVLTLAQDAEPVAAEASSSTLIDYSGFADLVSEVGPIREQRLLAKDEFFERALADGALLLDTRSAEAYRLGHIEGAVNLPFSDFTEDKLREVIGADSSRPVFIYCNNNFSDNVEPIALKSAPLALNIPTFINLYGYGYTNIWELEGVMSVKDIAWAAEPMFVLDAEQSARAQNP